MYIPSPINTTGNTLLPMRRNMSARKLCLTKQFARKHHSAVNTITTEISVKMAAPSIFVANSAVYTPISSPPENVTAATVSKGSVCIFLVRNFLESFSSSLLSFLCNSVEQLLMDSSQHHHSLRQAILGPYILLEHYIIISCYPFVELMTL